MFKILNLETINICNRKCFFCKFGDRKIEEAKSVMSMEIIEKMLCELISIGYKGSIRLHHVNEPMLDKRIYDIIRLIKKANITTEMTSNGDLINNTSLSKLHESGLDKLNLSAYDNESLNRFKDLQKLWEFHIHDMRPGKNLYTKLTNQAGLIDLDENFVNLKIQMVINNKCCLPFEQLVIGSNGEVALCCEDMYKLQNFGNVHNNSLTDIWNCEKFKMYREKLSQRKRSELELCSKCTFHGRSKKYYPVSLQKK